jgi:hypothetical protein
MNPNRLSVCLLSLFRVVISVAVQVVSLAGPPFAPALRCRCPVSKPLAPPSLLAFLCPSPSAVPLHRPCVVVSPAALRVRTALQPSANGRGGTGANPGSDRAAVRGAGASASPRAHARTPDGPTLWVSVRAHAHVPTRCNHCEDRARSEALQPGCTPFGAVRCLSLMAALGKSDVEPFGLNWS